VKKKRVKGIGQGEEQGKYLGPTRKGWKKKTSKKDQGVPLPGARKVGVFSQKTASTGVTVKDL